MRFKKLLLFSLILLGSSLPVSTLAATYTCGTNGVANSCTPSGLQTLINGANDGDTINIATGTHDWTGAGIGVLLSKRLTIRGGGTYAVDANHNDTGTWPVILNTGTATAFKITAPTGSGNPRITGIRFSGNPPFQYNFNDANAGLFINMSANVAFYRIDNNSFNSTGSHCGIYANSVGLIDHNFFIATGDPNGHCIYIQNWGASGNGDEVWAAPVGFGTASTFVFIETNTFRRTESIRASFENSFIDAQLAGKYVARYNYFRNGSLLVHDKSGGGNVRGGGMAVEIYNNTFEFGPAYSSDAWFTAYYHRDGTALIYNNNFVSNLQSWIKLVNARDPSVGSQGNWGVCDGTRLWDGNLLGLLGLLGSGYPCLDQVGRGKSVGMPPLFQLQESAPARYWSNTGAFTGGCGGTPEQGGAICNSTPGTIQAGRDYIFSTDASAALPGYTPYPYPHPLVSGTSPVAPTNLRVQ